MQYIAVCSSPCCGTLSAVHAGLGNSKDEYFTLSLTQQQTEVHYPTFRRAHIHTYSVLPLKGLYVGRGRLGPWTGGLMSRGEFQKYPNFICWSALTLELLIFFVGRSESKPNIHHKTCIILYSLSVSLAKEKLKTLQKS